MEKTILSKSSVVEGNKAVITETTETRWDIFQVEDQLRQLRSQKERLVEQSQYTLKEYNEVVAKETELKELKLELDALLEFTGDIEII